MNERNYTMDEYVTLWSGGLPMKRREEIVRCRDCKFGIEGGSYCAEGCADSWDWRNVEPDGFCKWAVKRKEVLRDEIVGNDNQ